MVLGGTVPPTTHPGTRIRKREKTAASGHTRPDLLTQYTTERPLRGLVAPVALCRDEGFRRGIRDGGERGEDRRRCFVRRLFVVMLVALLAEEEEEEPVRTEEREDEGETTDE